MASCSCNSGEMRKLNLPEKCFRGSMPFFLANVEEDLQGLFEFGPQLFGVLPVKVRATVQAENFTAKKIQFSVVFNLGVIAVQGHDAHGCFQ